MRSVPEWIGRNDDAKIPDRVKVRIYHKAKGVCAVCTVVSLSGQYDHIIPLILGGEHRETNLQWICIPCHKAKTALDVKLKAKVARVQKRHLGIKKPSKFAGSRDSKWKKRIDGTVVLR